MKQKLFKLIILVIMFSSITYSQSVSSDAIAYVSPTNLDLTGLDASYNKLQTFANYIYHKYKVESLSSTSAVISTTDQYPEGVWGRGYYTKLIENSEFVGENGKYNVLFYGYSDDNNKFRIVTPCLSYSSKAVLFHIYAYKSNKYRNSTCLGKIKAGLEYLLKNQQPNGGFIQYWWRTSQTDLRPDITENYVTSYATGDVIRALYEGYYFIETYDSANDSLLKKLYVGVKRAADYLKSPQCSEGNNNYVSFSIWGLASAYKLTGDKSYLNRAIFKYDNIKNYQDESGAWFVCDSFPKNPPCTGTRNYHDTHPDYMGIIIRGLSELYSAIPSQYDSTIKIDIKKSILKTINNFLVEGLRKGGVGKRLNENTGLLYSSNKKELNNEQDGWYDNNGVCYALNLVHGLKYVIDYNILTGNDKIYVQNFLNIITNSHITQINTNSLFAAEGNMDDNMISIGLQLLSTGSLFPQNTPVLSQAVLGLNPIIPPALVDSKSSTSIYSINAQSQWSHSIKPVVTNSDTIVGAAIGDFQGKGDELIIGVNTSNNSGWYLYKYNITNNTYTIIFTSPNWSRLNAITSWDADDDGKSEIITASYNRNTGMSLIYKSTVGESSITNEMEIWHNAGFKVKSLTTGDFDKTGSDYLVIGFEVVGSTKAVVYNARGFDSNGLMIKDKIYDKPDNREISALAAGDFDMDGYDDLILGFNQRGANPGAIVYKFNHGIDSNNPPIYNLNPDWKIAALAAGKFGGATDKRKDELLLGFITRTGTPLSAIYRSINASGSLDDRIHGFDGTNKVYALATGNLNNVMLSKMQYDANETGDVETNPEDYMLSQNYPNPFNPSTIIRYSVPQASRVRIEVFNLLGEKVATLVNNQMESGSYEVNWNARNFASGMYLIRIEALSLEGNKNFVQVKKAILVK